MISFSWSSKLHIQTCAGGHQVVTAGADTVLCSWKPPQDNGGEPVLNYVLEYAPEPLFNTWQEDGPYPDNTQWPPESFLTFCLGCESE